MNRQEKSKKLTSLHEQQSRIRNICILAHVDHGKTTLADALVASNGIISQRLAGKLRYMDSREDEQLRGITMKSSSIALCYEKNEEDYLINLIDSPGHIDFAGEVSTAVRLCDGSIIVVDVVEGVCPQTHAALRQSWHEHLKPVLVLNKIDRLILELKLSPSEAYSHLRHVLEQVNAITGDLFSSDVYEKSASRLTNDLTSPEDRFSDWAIDDEDDSHLYFAPECGNVVFASAIDGWGFRVEDFALMFAAKAGISPNVLRKTLWGDYYLNNKLKRIQKGANDKGKRPLFVQFVLENLWSVYEAVSITRESSKIEKIITSLGLKVNPRDLKHKDSKLCLTAILNQWLPLSKAVLSMVVENSPSPLQLADDKVQKLMCHKTMKFDSLHPQTQALKDNFVACQSEDAPIIVYVSKMLPYDRKSLPTNRPRPLTAEEINARREIARQRHREMTERLSEVSFEEKPDVVEIPSQGTEPVGPVFIAFARVYSGTLRKGQKLFVLKPKHNPKAVLQELNGDDLSLDIAAEELPKHVSTFEVSSLYMLMGRELEEIESAPAGNIVGIGGLEDHVLKSATLSTTIACPPFTEMMFQAPPIVRVAIDPENPAEMPRLVEGMKLLNQADPCVEVRVQETGEHVIIAAGEVHLQRCIDDLKLRYAEIDLNVSAPIVPFRETIVPPPQTDMVNEAIHEQSVHTKDKAEKTDFIEITTPDKTVTIAIRARPLPKEVVTILVDNYDLLKTLNKCSWQYEKTRIKGSLNEITRKEIDELRSKLDEAFECADGDWKDVSTKIWSFGPHQRGPNMLLNMIPDYDRPSVWQCIDEADSKCLRNYDNSIVSGFQIATLAGPLCEEPMMGVCYQVERWDFHSPSSTLDLDNDDNDDSEDARPSSSESRLKQGSGATSGQLISCMKDACRKAFQTQPQRLMAAMYSCEIQANSDVLGKLYAVIGKRNGRVVFEDLKEGSAAFIIKAVIPVVESFGFAEEMCKKTSGLAIPQLQFSHWETIDTDPFWVPTTEEEYLYHGDTADSENQARKYMDHVRRRKGLVVDEQIVEFAEKQRTLTRNK